MLLELVALNQKYLIKKGFELVISSEKIRVCAWLIKKKKNFGEELERENEVKLL